MPSALEFIHPDGPGRRVSVHGAGPAAALVPAPATDAGPPDLVLLAPARGERKDPAWLEQAAGVAATVADDGLVVTAHPSRRLRSRLVAAGPQPRAPPPPPPPPPPGRGVFPLAGPAAPVSPPAPASPRRPQ